MTDPDDPDEASQLAGIAHLLAIAAEQNPPTVPLRLLPQVPGPARTDQLAALDAEVSAHRAPRTRARRPRWFTFSRTSREKAA